MRIFASSLTESARDWINGLPSGSIKTPEELERDFNDRWCKKESMASFYSQYLEVCKQTNKDVREFNDMFNTLISKLQLDFLPKSVVLQHYLNSFEGIYNLPSRIDYLQP
jgi:lantibiotic modifying enzyme